MSVVRKVLRRSTDTHDRTPVVFRILRHRASENISNRIPPDMNGGHSAIHMAPYTVGKDPSIAFCIFGGHTVACMVWDISDCTSAPRNKGGHRSVGT
jgi:hypothetical protein